MNLNTPLIPLLMAITLFFCAEHGLAEEKEGKAGSFLGQEAANHLNPERIALMKPAEIIHLMKPALHGNILDLGAGFGLFTFPLSDAVGSQGSVYATDVDKQSVEFLREQALKMGATNVFPVLVSPKGIDPFYSRQNFDLILMADVIVHIDDFEQFLRQFRNVLKVETGRLWLVNMRFDPDFTKMEFADPVALRKAIRSMDSDSPILRRLNVDIKKSLTGLPEGDSHDSFRDQLVDNFNRILDDPTLWADIQAGKVRLNQREKKLRSALAQFIDKEGIFKQGTKELNPKSKLAWRYLNRIIIQDLFDSHYFQKTFGVDKQRPDSMDQLFSRIYTEEKYLRLFENNGYTLVKEHGLLPYHYVFEFKRTL